MTTEQAPGSILAGESTPAEGAAEAPAWTSGFDDDTKQWLGGMGVDKLAEKEALAKLIPMYRGAEKKLGVPADQLLRLPKDDTDKDGYRAVMSKLGLPDTPDGYELQVPEGADSAFAKQAATWFHEAGIPKGAAANVAEKWNEYVAQHAELHEQEKLANEEKYQTSKQKDLAALRAEWGEQSDANIELARRVARAAGLIDKEADAIERSVGVGRAVKMFAELGKAMGEHRFVDGAGSGTFGMSPEGARARIADLRKDPAWMSAYLSGDADKRAELTRLHTIGFPDAEAA